MLIKSSELNILSSFDHPNVIKAHDFYFDKEDKAHIIIELANYPLDVAMIRHKPDEPTRYMWMYQIASAIHFFHRQGYFHCDLKSENILIKDGSAILSDFSLSFPFGTPMEFCGTPTWTSPESLKEITVNFSDQELDHKSSDIYSPGLLFMYIMTGEEPMPFIDREYVDENAEIDDIIDTIERYNNFTSNYIDIIDSAISDPNLSDLIKKMCDPIVSERIRTVDEVLESDFFTSLNYQEPVYGTLKKPDSMPNITKKQRSIIISKIRNIAKNTDISILPLYIIVSLYRRVIHHFNKSEYDKVVDGIVDITGELLYIGMLEQPPDGEIVRKILTLSGGIIRPKILYDLAVIYKEACFGLSRLLDTSYDNIDDYIKSIYTDHMKYKTMESKDEMMNRERKDRIVKLADFDMIDTVN